MKNLDFDIEECLRNLASRAQTRITRRCNIRVEDSTANEYIPLSRGICFIVLDSTKPHGEYETGIDVSVNYQTKKHINKNNNFIYVTADVSRGTEVLDEFPEVEITLTNNPNSEKELKEVTARIIEYLYSVENLIVEEIEKY